MPSAPANGIDLHYESFGRDDGEALLLISGLGAQMIRWPVSFCEDLAARGYRVIRFDNRDAGLSTDFSAVLAPDPITVSAAVKAGLQPEVPYTLLDMAADVVGLLDALSIQRAHVVGRSMGGMIAQLVGSEYPERVLSLTSIMSSTGNPALPAAAPDVMMMLMRRAPNPLEDEAGYLAGGAAFSRRISSPGYPFDEAGRRTLLLAELRRAYHTGGFGRQLAAIVATGDNRARLAKITAPTLVLHGADDPLIPVACGQDTAANIPGAQFMVIEGMGHDFPMALHGMVADAIERNARLAKG